MLLTDHFLIAMPEADGSFFSKSLIYIADHSERGAFGLMINRPIDLNLGSFFEKVDIPASASALAKQPVFFGGPVQQNRGFILHHPAGDWQSSFKINSKVSLTTSRDILHSMANEGLPSKLILALGYAGWGAGQLEQELARNAWLSVPASVSILFDLPSEEKLPAAMKSLGVDWGNFVSQAGHA